MTSSNGAGEGHGASVRRVEDPPFLRGTRPYTDDLREPGALYAVFVRSGSAHATINEIDKDEALAMPGVVGVYTAADLKLEPFATAGPPVDTPEEMRRPVLATDKVRFIGEPIAVVVAETRAQAVDAAELVYVDTEDLDVLVDMTKALDAGRAASCSRSATWPRPGRRARTRWPTPRCATGARFVNQRLAAVPMEPGAALAKPDPDVAAASSSTRPARARTPIQGAICAATGIEADKLRVVSTATGGGFGARIACYPEQVVVVALARELGKAVRYIETRSETMLEMQHGRAQVQDVEIGGTRDGKITGLKVRVIADCGAYPADAALMPMLTGLMSSGVYTIPKVDFHFDAVVTNTTPIGAYRGAGRPEATALVERAVDMFAAEIGMDPADVRRKNFIPDGEFPHQTVTGRQLRLGRLPRGAGEVPLQRRLRAAARRPEGASRPWRRRPTGAWALLLRRVDRVRLRARDLRGARGRHGGRHRRHVLARPGPRDRLRAAGHRHARHPARRTSRSSSPTPSWSSAAWARWARARCRSAAAPSRSATDEVLEKARRLAAHLLEADAGDIEVVPGQGLGVAGSPASAIPWAQLAAAAKDPSRAPEGFDGGLAGENDFETPDATYPFGTHLAVVEVDTETGLAHLIRHITVDDSGRIHNEKLLEGQVHGGIAQGVAQALFEEIAFDEDGNNVTGSLASYAIPSASDLPSFETERTQTPSPRNPLGAKGIGESGAIGSTPAVWNAVVDALQPFGVRNIDMPATPQRVWQAISAAG